MDKLPNRTPAPQASTFAQPGRSSRFSRIKDDELRKQVLRERAPLGGGGPRLETGNTVDTTILSGAKLTLGGA